LGEESYGLSLLTGSSPRQTAQQVMPPTIATADHLAHGEFRMG